KLMGAYTAISSCGIAYVFRFIHAAQQAAVEMGIHPKQAREIMCQTMVGAVELLRYSGEHPEEAIDRVTTPGGIAIRGLNAMEATSFTHSVICGIKAALI
ncbi:MAG: pyrroline-5-carboxylate reductase, partial [Muribaculaceae bacterium]|nr:pyrroline-5-carboxylate reductase [Muribaculaceae bacterium]